MPDYSSPLTERIREACQDAGISPSAAAVRMGRGKDGLKDILDGSSLNPRRDTFKLLAEALGVNLEWLQTGNGPKRVNGASDAPPKGAGADSFSNSFDTARKFLLDLVVDQQLDPAVVSEAIGQEPDYLDAYLYRGTPKVLPRDVRDRLAERFGFDPAKLDPAPHSATAKPKPKVTTGMAEIVELDVKAGNALAGAIHPGQDLAFDHESVVARWQVPTEILHGHASGPASTILIITAVGDSNVPVFFPGERLMVDTNDRTPSPPGFFAYWDGYGVVVKRMEILEHLDPPLIRLTSANKDAEYLPRELTFDKVQIRGRVLGKWFWT